MKHILYILLIFCTSSLIGQQTDSLAPAVYNWNKLEPKKEDTRIRRQILEGSTTSLSYFEIHTSTLEPGKAPHPPHTHADQDELIIVKEGFLKVTIKDSTRILGAGSVALAIPGEEHGFENGGDVPVTYFILKFKSILPMNIER